MRFAVAFSFLVPCSHAFLRLQKQLSHPQKISLSSTLSPESPTHVANDDNVEKKAAISMQIDELAQVLGGRGRAQIVWDCYSIGIDPADYFGTINLGYDDYESIFAMLPSARRTQKLDQDTMSKLASLYPQGGKVEGGVAKLSYISRASDSSTKILLTLADGLKMETIIIPWKGQLSTLCVSSQVGKLNKIRDLTPTEILSQVFFAKKLCRLEGLPEITNIAFMGIGDSADNADNIVEATKIMTTRELFQLSISQVTVSTIAPTPNSFKAFSEAPCVIAWSVYAANDEVRKQLVPTTKFSMHELRQGLIDSLLDSPMNDRHAILEVELMEGINDSIKEVDELAAFTKVVLDSVPGSKVVINIIPFNDTGHGEYRQPKKKNVISFQQRLQSYGLCVRIHATQGQVKLNNVDS